jgi:hypothetical protein
VVRRRNQIISPLKKPEYSNIKEKAHDIQDLQGVEGGVRVLMVEFLLYRGHCIPDQGEK